MPGLPLNVPNQTGVFFLSLLITLKCSGTKPNELLGVIFVFCRCNLWVYLNVLVAVIFRDSLFMLNISC